MIEPKKIETDDNKLDSKIFENEIKVTVLITSISQRDITIETAQYYSDMCNEVILVDEQKPHLSDADVENLNYKGIKYIPYGEGSNLSLTSTYEKRLIAANHSNNKYIVHSNHDERYTYNGLIKCINELENDKKLAFCVGQCIAIRKNTSGIYFTRSYENLSGYLNINKVDGRLYYHAEKYAPIGHYGVWRKNAYIKASEITVMIHNKMPSVTMMEEVIFELAADLTGNSKAISDLYWIRNRINPPLGHSTDKGEHILRTIETKLLILLDDYDVQIENIIDKFRNSHFAFIRPNLASKFILVLKKCVRIFIKKKQVDDIHALLDDSGIKYEKNDLSNIFKSIHSLL